MISESKVERFVQEPGLLVDLCREVVKELGPGSGSQETAGMETQLREIARTIEKLDKQGVSVPEALRAEKTRLATALDSHAEASRILRCFAEGLENVLSDITVQIGFGEDSNQRKTRTRSSMSPKTDRSLLRQMIIEGLIRSGGSAQKSDLFRYIETHHKSSLLPGDFEFAPDGKRIYWKLRCGREARKMRREGVLKPDSPRGIWELSEDYR